MLVGDYRVTTGPASEPVTLAEAKAHLRVDYDDEDDYITALIVTARDYAEKHTGRALLTQTVTHVLPCFPDGDIRLFRAPVTSLTTITYFDSSNASATLDVSADVILNTFAEPGTITPAVGTSWPSTAVRPNAVTLVYQCGWATAGQVPAGIRHAMLLIIGEMFENRENSVRKLPTAAEHLLNHHHVRLW